MTEEALRQALSQSMAKAKVRELTALAGSAKYAVADLVALCFCTTTPALAFRAAWVLEHIAIAYPEQFRPHFAAFLRRLPEQHNQSCRRHFTKILLHYSKPAHARTFAFTNQEQIVETVLDWLIDPRAAVAVQVNCLELLLHLAEHERWLQQELQAQTEFLLQNGSSAMQSRGRKILKQLYLINSNAAAPKTIKL